MVDWVSPERGGAGGGGLRPAAPQRPASKRPADHEDGINLGDRDPVGCKRQRLAEVAAPPERPDAADDAAAAGRARGAGFDLAEVALER